MAQRFVHGHRRRRISIVTANTPNGSPAASSAARNRVVVVNRPPGRKPQPRSLVQSIATKRITGVTQPPVPGAGGTLKPLQPNWTLGTMRPKSFRNIVRPIVLRTKTVRPVGLVTPRKSTIVPPTRRGRRLNGLSLVAAFDAFEMPSPTTIRPIVVPRPSRLLVHRIPKVVVPHDGRLILPPPITDSIVVPHRFIRRLSTPTLVDTFFDATRQIAPHFGEAIVVPRPIRTKRLRGLSMILPFDAFEMPPPLAMRPLVVPSRLKGSKELRSAILVSAKGSLNPRDLTATDPLVVPYRKAPRLAPWAISSLYRKFVEAPPEHFPMPRVSVARAPRRTPTMWPRPIASQSIYQFPGNMVEKPWDLIAACIAWLRQQPTIVAAFGDVKGSKTSQKFVSDVELPKTSPPFVVFNEPIEVESYETADGSGMRGSKVDGLFEIHVYATGKLDSRQKADTVAASLQDAPLQFTDGVLLYLRRTERKFPSFRSPGPDDDVALYHRIVEFHYIIERYF